MLPTPKIERWIESLWELDGHVPRSRERELPRGSVSLTINLAGSHVLVNGDAQTRLAGAWITGLQEQTVVTGMCERTWTCGARLTLDGAHRLLRIPAHELTNRVIELETLWGCIATNLIARVREAATSAERLSLLGEFLIERMMLSGPSRMGRWHPGVVWAVDHILAHPGETPVRWVAQELGWSEKRLYRHFIASVGTAPRTLGRIARFHEVLRALHDRRFPSIADSAHALGYCDQAHLAREFRNLAGMTPVQYLQGRGYSLDYGYARVEVSDSSKT
jgi:AraC-like DNA-binding protein